MNAKSLPLLLFGASLALLAFEVSLLRLLAFLHWYHFAYLVISLALLGFAASGTAMYLLRPFCLRHADSTAPATLLLAAVSMSGGRQALALIPTDLFLAIWQPVQLIWLAFLFLILFLPFFFAAFFLILSFTAGPERIGGLYAANLLGSGAGSLAALVLLDCCHPATIPYILGLITAMLALPLVPRRRPGFLAIALGGVGLCALLALAPTPVTMSTFKPLARALTLPQAHIIASEYDPLGVIEVVQSPHLRYAPGLGLNFTGDVPPRPLVFVDGEMLGPVATSGQADLTLLRQGLPSLPYRLRPVESVLVLAAGSGEEIGRALAWGVEGIIAVERNAALVGMLAGLHAHGDSVYLDARVRTVVQTPRAFLMADDRRFDLIVLANAEGLTGASFGMRALHENYLLTREAFARMLERLSPHGMLVASTMLDTPMRRPLRLAALMALALRDAGIGTPERHLLALKNWNMATLLLSKQPLTPTDIERIHRHATAAGLVLLYPAQAGDDSLADAIHHPDHPPGPFHLTPPTDARPYFNHFLSLQAVPIVLASQGRAGLILTEWAYIMIYVTLALLAVGGLILVLLPLALWLPRRGHGCRLGLGYFAAIGVGFMAVEMLLIAKLVELLGDPVYAVAGTIAAILIFAGIGSRFSASAHLDRSRLAAAAALVIAFPLLVALLPLHLMPVFGLPLGWRAAIIMLALAPPATAMGVFFPAGIRALDTGDGAAAIPWAWGVNGYASVMTPPLAMLVALNLGLGYLALMAAACYGVAVSLFPQARDAVNNPG